MRYTLFAFSGKISVFCLAAAFLMGIASKPAQAAMILNQIGSSPAFYTAGGGVPANTSDVYESSLTPYITAVVDDFTVSGAMNLTNVSAVTQGYDGFGGYSGVTGWEVAIYSSLTAASSSITGDVYDNVFAPADVELTAPFGGAADVALVSIPTDISIPAAGTYYVAVLADNAYYSNGQIGILESTGAPGTTPGGSNSYLTNPGGGYGFTSNLYAIDPAADAAYSITAGTTQVPEPAALSVLGIPVAMVLLRRKRQTA